MRFLLIKAKESSYRFPKMSFFICPTMSFRRVFSIFGSLDLAIFKLLQCPGHFAHLDKISDSASFRYFFESFFLFDVFGKLPDTVSSASQT